MHQCVHTLNVKTSNFPYTDAKLTIRPHFTMRCKWSQCCLSPEGKNVSMDEMGDSYTANQKKKKTLHIQSFSSAVVFFSISIYPSSCCSSNVTISSSAACLSWTLKKQIMMLLTSHTYHLSPCPSYTNTHTPLSDLY